MGVADVPRWVWVGIALAVGLAHAWVREYSSQADPLDDYPVLLTDPRQFEQALTAEYMGRQAFIDVTVYPHWVRNGSGSGKRLVHLVTGGYWDGRTQAAADGLQARWEPACFIAPVPYEPVSAVDGMKASGTVLDYLNAMGRTHGVRYQYAWWWWALTPTFTSLVGSVLLIGGALPTAINLIAFGTLTRPPREKRPSLWRVRLRRREQSEGAAEDAVVRPKGEKTVASEAVAEAPATAVAAVTPPVPVAALAPTIETPAESPTVDGERHFGARSDDFYPTEVHVVPPHGPKPAC